MPSTPQATVRFILTSLPSQATGTLCNRSRHSILCVLSTPSACWGPCTPRVLWSRHHLSFGFTFLWAEVLCFTMFLSQRSFYSDQVSSIPAAQTDLTSCGLAGVSQGTTERLLLHSPPPKTHSGKTPCPPSPSHGGCSPVSSASLIHLSAGAFLHSFPGLGGCDQMRWRSTLCLRGCIITSWFP